MLTYIIGVFTVLSLSFGDGCREGRHLIKSGGLTAPDKQAIVDEHNRLRQSVALGMISTQPPAANMLEMKWDEELAARAQLWADQCIIDHDEQGHRNVGRFEVGQNVAASWTSRSPRSYEDSLPEFNKQIKAWFDEVSSFGYNPIGMTMNTGHYSQLVWGTTSHVGCGFSFFYNPYQGYTKLYICNYGPCGNVLGLKPYELGPPSCNNFGLADSRKYSGLCSIKLSSTYDSFYISDDDSYQVNIVPEKTGDKRTVYKYSEDNKNEFSYNTNSKNYEVEGWFDQNNEEHVTPSTTTQRPFPKFTFKPFLYVGRYSKNLGEPVEVKTENPNYNADSKVSYYTETEDQNNIIVIDDDEKSTPDAVLRHDAYNPYEHIISKSYLAKDNGYNNSKVHSEIKEPVKVYSFSFHKLGEPFHRGNSTSVKFNTGTNRLQIGNEQSPTISHLIKSDRLNEISVIGRNTKVSKLTKTVFPGRRTNMSVLPVTHYFTRSHTGYKFGTAIR